MVVVTFHISKITVAIVTFDRGSVRGTMGIGQTKRTTMRTGGAVFFNISISFVTMITVVLILGHGRHGKYGIVMLVWFGPFLGATGLTGIAPGLFHQG
jgi:hypothetical protein